MRNLEAALENFREGKGNHKLFEYLNWFHNVSYTSKVSSTGHLAANLDIPNICPLITGVKTPTGGRTRIPEAHQGCVLILLIV